MKVLLQRRVVLAGLMILPTAIRAQAGTLHEIEIRQFKFSPKGIAAQPGDRVTWTNKDLAPHTVTAVDGSYDSGAIAKGEPWSLEVTEDTFGDYFCAFHPQMKGSLAG
ncbi:MAG: cupredoxin family copper-binding protein [Roseobacter sp.]